MSAVEGGELGDKEAVNRELRESVRDKEMQEEEDEAEYIPRCWYAYTQEHKLVVINYFYMT
jgi:hypothetical protein